MSLSRLSSMPPELKLVTYYYLDHRDLLAVSHVSRFWRAVVLADKRWEAWFEMIINPVDKTSVRDSITRFKVSDVISPRAIVTLCFSTKCSLCSKDTTDVFLPLLKRICEDCLHPETHAIISLTAALAIYDLSEKDVRDVVALCWEETDPEKKKKNPIKARVKLVSALAVKRIAIEKYGGEGKLAAHLEQKKSRFLAAYEKRLAEYNTANAERKKLKAAGDLAGAAAVTWQNNKKLPKTRPQMPPLLKAPSPPAFYQEICILPTNYLTLESGKIVTQELLKCMMCEIIAELRAYDEGSEPQYPDFIKPALLPAHERTHYARKEDPCLGSVVSSDDDDSFFLRCMPCLNRSAIEIKEEHDAMTV